MALDYKQQMWLMTDGLGEWMTHQEMRRRRRRRLAMVVGGLVVVTLAVLGVVLLLFPRNVNHYHNYNTFNNYYGSGQVSNTQPTNDSASNVVNNYYDIDKLAATESARQDAAKDAVTIDKNGIVVQGADGESVKISLDIFEKLTRL